MSAVFGERLTFGQANGQDVELVVWGDEWYSVYETVSGYPAVYDEQLGVFCYAQVVEGEFRSTKAPITGDPPAGVEPHARESDDIRAEKAARARQIRASRRRGGSAIPSSKKEETP